MDFSKFDQQVDLNKLKEDAEEIKKNGGTGDFPEVEEGTYETKIEKLEIKSTKDGRPMLSAMFRILNGQKFGNQCLFFNRVLYGTKNDANMIAGALTWLEELEPSEEVGPIIFQSYSQFNELVLDIAEDVADLEYKVYYDPEAFNPIKIKEVYD